MRNRKEITNLQKDTSPHPSSLLPTQGSWEKGEGVGKGLSPHPSSLLPTQGSREKGGGGVGKGLFPHPSSLLPTQGSREKGEGVGKGLSPHPSLGLILFVNLILVFCFILAVSTDWISGICVVTADAIIGCHSTGSATDTQHIRPQGLTHLRRKLYFQTV